MGVGLGRCSGGLKNFFSLHCVVLLLVAVKNSSILLGGAHVVVGEYQEKKTIEK